MKKIIIFSCAMVLSLCTKTLRAADVVHVADKDGNTVSFLLSDHPAVTFDDENVIITTDATKVYYPMSAYRKFSMEAVATGVSATVASEPTFVFTDGLKAEGLAPSTPVTVYSVNGKALAKGVANAQGSLSLGVNVPKGTVCIVKTATATFKFVK